MRKQVCAIVAMALGIFIAPTLLSALYISHPAEPNAISINASTINFILPGGLQVRCDMCTWRVASGKNEIVIDAGSIGCVTNCGLLDNLTSPELMSMIANAAITEAIVRGYIQYGESCNGAESTRVYLAACVQRSGTGVGTYFTVCDPNSFCVRKYNLCRMFPSGTPQVNLLGAESPGCPAQGSCQSTCTQAGID